jgi:hypothetical protein
VPSPIAFGHKKNTAPFHRVLGFDAHFMRLAVDSRAHVVAGEGDERK